TESDLDGADIGTARSKAQTGQRIDAGSTCGLARVASGQQDIHKAAAIFICWSASAQSSRRTEVGPVAGVMAVAKVSRHRLASCRGEERGCAIAVKPRRMNVVSKIPAVPGVADFVFKIVQGTQDDNRTRFEESPPHLTAGSGAMRAHLKKIA